MYRCYLTGFIIPGDVEDVCEEICEEIDAMIKYSDFQVRDIRNENACLTVSLNGKMKVDDLLVMADAVAPFIKNGNLMLQNKSRNTFISIAFKDENYSVCRGNLSDPDFRKMSWQLFPEINKIGRVTERIYNETVIASCR